MQAERTKRCSKCREVKPVCEFKKAKSNSDGFSCLCKLCCNDAQRKAYAENPDKYRKYSKKYRDGNLVRVRDQGRRYRADHVEKTGEYNKKYYDEHVEARREAAKVWRAENPEKAQAAIRKWRTDHPEEIRKYNKEYRSEHQERVRAQSKKWDAEHRGPERVAEAWKKWREKNPEKVKECRRKFASRNKETISASGRRQREELRDPYIRNKLRRIITNPSPCLIEIKRQSIIMKRTLKQIKERIKHESDRADVQGVQCKDEKDCGWELQAGRTCCSATGI